MPFDAATYTVDPLTLTTPRERLEYLRDFLLRLPAERFDMRQYARRADGSTNSFAPSELTHDCGTAACVCGWAIALFEPRMFVGDDIAAADLLGLEPRMADELFYPTGFGRPGLYPLAHAVAVLTHLIQTGEVDWSVAGSEAQRSPGTNPSLPQVSE